MSRTILTLAIIFPFILFANDLETNAWNVLNNGMVESNPVKRAQTLTALGSIGLLPRALSLIEGALTDKDPTVRQTAVAVLGDMKSMGSIPKLREALNDDAPEVNFTAAKALWDLGDQSGESIFIDVLAGERKTSEGVIKSGMRDAKSKLRNPAALAKMGVNETSGALLGPLSLGIVAVEDFMKDSSAPARALSAKLLSTITDAESLAQLEAALQDKNPAVRAAAARGLGQRNSRESVPRIEPLLSDSHNSARCMGAAAIIKLIQPAPSVSRNKKRRTLTPALARTKPEVTPAKPNPARTKDVAPASK
jgi:HEAT repeat protein